MRKTLTASQINNCPGRHRLLRSFNLLFLDITAEYAVFTALGEVAVAFLIVVVHHMIKLLAFWEPVFSWRHAMKSFQHVAQARTMDATIQLRIARYSSRRTSHLPRRTVAWSFRAIRIVVRTPFSVAGRIEQEAGVEGRRW